MTRYALIAALLAAVALAGLAGWQGYRFGKEVEVARSAAALARANAANAARQKELVRSIEKVSADVETERAEMENRLADADLALDGLREAIRHANAGTDTAGPGQPDAASARTSLAECAAEYRTLGRQHDQLRAIVIGLQAYAREVSRP